MNTPHMSVMDKQNRLNAAFFIAVYSLFNISARNFILFFSLVSVCTNVSNKFNHFISTFVLIIYL